MKLPVRIFKHIASTFLQNYSESNEEVKKHALLILKIYDIKLINNILYHRDFSYEGLSGFHASTLPYSNISNLDIESFENILNSHPQTACLMSPLFDCIGWVISNSSGAWRMSFIGSSTYDLWKQIYINPEEDVKWYEGLDEYDTNWRKGKGWVDGIDMEDLKAKNQIAWKVNT